YHVCWAARYNVTAATTSGGATAPSDSILLHSIHVADLYLDISHLNSPDEVGLGIGLGSFERFSSAPTKEVFVSSTNFLVEWSVSSGP
ncbi:unnamed protein product, partial [Amoebophrya sp. A25]